MGAIAQATVGRFVSYVETALDVMLRENKRPKKYVGHAEDFSVEAFYTEEKTLTIEIKLR